MYPDCLRKTVAFHSAHPEAGLSWCQFDLIDDRGVVSNPDWNSYVRPEWLLSLELYAELSLIWGCLPYNIANVTLARAATEQAGFFREDMTYSGDFEYWGRMAAAAPVGRIGERLMKLRAHAAQASAKLSGRVRNVTESLEVSHSLLTAVRPSFEAEMRRCFRWKVVPAWAMTFWLCVRAKRWDLAGECWERLKPFGTPLFLVTTAIVTHLLHRVGADTRIHRWLFLDAHYAHLSSIAFNDEGITR